MKIDAWAKRVVLQSGPPAPMGEEEGQTMPDARDLLMFFAMVSLSG